MDIIAPGRKNIQIYVDLKLTYGDLIFTKIRSVTSSRSVDLLEVDADLKLLGPFF